MSDLFQGQTMSEAYTCQSAGNEHTFSFNFQPDKVVITNLTQWTGTAAKKPISVWIRDNTTAGHAFQQVVIDSSAGASFNFADLATNGFTDASTDAGTTAYNAALISAVTAADPCVVTTTAVHGLTTGQMVRITDLGNDMPTERGMEQINNKRFKVIVLSTTTFSLQDPITGLDIDSTLYTAWVAGGRVTLVSRDISYETGFVYDAATYKLTVGTSAIGANDDELLVEAFKYGQLVNLGDLA